MTSFYAVNASRVRVMAQQEVDHQQMNGATQYEIISAVHEWAAIWKDQRSLFDAYYVYAVGDEAIGFKFTGRAYGSHEWIVYLYMRNLICLDHTTEPI